MPDSETLASWLMLACLSLFTAVSIVAGCVLGIYMAEARYLQRVTGEPSTVFDEIWEDFRPRPKPVRARRTSSTSPAAVRQ